MFIDHVKIIVQGGDGGNGCVSFRREKYVPRGGPDGGNGGAGGSVILTVDPSISTLLDLKYHPVQRAERGSHGKGKNQHGKSGQNTIVLVPPGTVILDDDTAEPLADLVAGGETFVAARGGQGGRGNASLANFHNRLPRFAELGEPGGRRKLRLELKIIADIAIIGLPNSGKSTLLSRITEAHPRIADYPFTTLSPNLGVVDAEDYTRFVVADIPGLIAGAHEGVGLGHDFLRHIERTKVLVFLLDASLPNPVKDYETLRNELELHDPALVSKPQIIVANKMDLPKAEKNWPKARRTLAKRKAPIVAVSALEGKGLKRLIRLMDKVLGKEREAVPEPASPLDITKRYTFRPEFGLRKRAGAFELSGDKPEKWASMTDFANEEAVAHLRHKLSHLGIDAALRREGADGKVTLRIKGQEFEYTLEA
ncbi:MAG: GTPase ObgE [Candidatus Abyssobacteria bacterium SURF_17]|uniref:GTPase Obg n=1 Tax=Candidatus Abyssobacteria bacterium SURF_17 TaxID=2093361 RepID=A0A419EYT6_9BACT|nr:MAG: GTPase ObgE [Candidatus Abyssubacteria bacterium SURF_17]